MSFEEQSSAKHDNSSLRTDLPGLKMADFNITEQTVVNGIMHTRAPEASFFESKYEFGDKLGQ